jgi:single-stranded DNA-binding protein
VNRVELRGTVTQEPVTWETDHGERVWEATVAVNGVRYDPVEGGQGVTSTYVRLWAFGSVAEVMERRGFGRGVELYVVGELDQAEVRSSSGEVERKTRVRVLVASATRRP